MPKLPVLKNIIRAYLNQHYRKQFYLFPSASTDSFYREQYKRPKSISSLELSNKGPKKVYQQEVSTSRLYSCRSIKIEQSQRSIPPTTLARKK